MKKFKFILLIIILVITGCSSPNEQDIDKPSFSIKYDFYKPKMWVLEDDDSKVYLFGSVHIGNDDMYPFPDTIFEAISSSEVLAVESDIVAINDNSKALLEIDNLMKFEDDTTLGDVLTTDQLNKFNEIVKDYGVSIMASSKYIPIYYYSLLSSLIYTKTDYKSDYGIDLNLIYYAMNNDIEVVEIEDPVYTYELLSNLSMDTQVFLMINSLDSYKNEDYINQSTDFLVRSWTTGYLHEFVAIDKMFSGESLSKKYYDEYNNVLETIRNKNMTEKVIEYLHDDRDYFYVVGSLHLEGEYNVIKQLTEKGYTVTRVVY